MAVVAKCSLKEKDGETMTTAVALVATSRTALPGYARIKGKDSQRKGTLHSGNSTMVVLCQLLGD